MKSIGKLQYVASATASVAQPLTEEKFYELIRTNFVKDVVNNARDFLQKGEEYVEDYQRIKKGLPAVMWCGVSADQTKRKSQDLQPTGLFMIDIDHCKNKDDVIDLFHELYKLLYDNNEYHDHLMIAHITPSGLGLRLVLRNTGCQTIQDEIAKFARTFSIVKKYGDVDEVVHDYSRLSFLVGEKDFLYICKDVFTNQIEYNFVSEKTNNVVINQSTTDPDNYEEIRKTYKYNNIPLVDIVDKYVEFHGTPQVGARHEFYNCMAKDFRNLCNNDPEVLHAVLPRFGNSFDETWKQCQSMTKDNHTTSKSRDFYNFLVGAGVYPKKVESESSIIADEIINDNIDDSIDEIIDYKKELGNIPPIFKEFVNVAPNDFVMPTITALLPIMGTLTSYLRAYYLDGNLQSTSFYSVLYAPAGSGKSFINRLQDALLYKIRQRDLLNMVREQIYKTHEETRKETERHEKNPHVSVRIFPAINSQTEFLEKMRDNHGYHMFTSAEEIDTFNKGTKAAGGDKSDLFRVAWDNGVYGQSFKGKESFKGNVRLFYNVLLTGTPGQLTRYYKDVENGMITRVCFAEIQNQSFANVPIWKELTAEDKKVINSFVDTCDKNTYSNDVESYDIFDDIDEDDFVKNIEWQSNYNEPTYINMSWIFEPILNWLEKHRIESLKENNFAHDTFRRRTAVKGFRLAMICTQVYKDGCEKHKKEIIDFVIKWMNYDISESLRIFGNAFNTRVKITSSKSQNFKSLYELLGKTFTRSELAVQLRKLGLSTPTTGVLYLWKKENLIKKIGKYEYEKQ